MRSNSSERCNDRMTARIAHKAGSKGKSSNNRRGIAGSSPTNTAVVNTQASAIASRIVSAQSMNQLGVLEVWWTKGSHDSR